MMTVSEEGRAVHTDTVIEVMDLKKHYREVRAVDGISFQVRRGEVFTLLGPNGAGKTTTVEILEGLKEADSGSLTILGETCQKVPRPLKERMGVLLQETVFVDRLKVIEIAQMFASFFTRSLPPEEILALVSLTDKAQARVENLSGGQRQRLAIGMALINDPEIIFLDEPTTGLDPQARRSIWSLMERLKEEKKTIFLTTHYMEEAQRLSDTIYIMDHGQIIAWGTPRDLIAAYSDQSIIELQEENIGEEDLFLLQDNFCTIQKKEKTFYLYTQDLTRDLAHLLEWGKERDLPFTNLTFRQPNLEDVFLNLTGKGLRD